MGVTAAHIRELTSLGITGDMLIRVIEIIEDASLLTSRDGRDAKAKSAARSKAYRDRSREARDVTRHGDGVTTPPSSSFPPIPSLITTPPETSLRSVNPERERVVATWPADAFDLFWKAYPLKVGRKAAFKKLNAVRLNAEVEFPKLLDAVARYGVNVDPNFIAHATTWLNRGSWDDEVRNKNGHGAGSNRTAKATGSTQTGADSILAGMGRLAARNAERKLAERSGDREREPGFDLADEPLPHRH